MSRPLPAPSAARTANSLRRTRVRVSNAPARFAHAIKSTSPALAISTSSGVRVSPSMASRNGIVASSRLPLDSGYSRANSAPMAASSRWAVSCVTPGFKRAMKPSQDECRPAIACARTGPRSNAK